MLVCKGSRFSIRQGMDCQHMTACCAGGIREDQVECRRAALLAHFRGIL